MLLLIDYFTVVRGLFWLRMPASPPTIILDFQSGMRFIQPVMSQGYFGHTEMATNLGSNSQLHAAEKGVFAYHRGKKSSEFF